MKKLLLIMSLLCCCSSLMSTGSSLPDNAKSLALSDGLVAYYPFNGNANDESGNGNHGTIIGNVELVADKDGNPNSAYRFPGQPLNYISVPDNEVLHCSTFTLSAWVYTDAEDYGSGYLINKGRDITNGSYRLYVRGVGGTVLYGGSNDAYIDDIPETKVWHFIAGTVEGDVAKFYLDGILMDERTLSRPFSYSNSQPLTLGMHYYSGVPSYWAYPLNGVLDEVRIYNRALSESEIKSLYSGTSSGEGDVPISSIKLTVPYNRIDIGETVKIDAIIKPSNASNKNLEWRSFNESVATVSNGVVTGVGVGPTTIFASATDGSGIQAGIRISVGELEDTPQEVPIYANRGFVKYTGKIPVKGLTADGKSQVFVCWPNENNLILSGIPKIVITNLIGQNLYPEDSELGSVSSLQTKFGEQGFIYEAPKDFMPNYIGDYYLANIMIPINTGSDISYELLASVRIYRPGLLLVHGLWGDPTSFEDFGKYLDYHRIYYPFYNLVDYSASHGDSFYNNTHVNNVIEIACSNLFERFLKNGIVSSSYDLVGHSMGGILSRLYVQEINPDAAHKIITVNTPHWGSAIADRGQQLRETLRPLLDEVTVAWIYGKIETIYYENPAIYDLMTTSIAIKGLGKKAHVLREQKVPVHAVCSYLEESQASSKKSKNEIAADLLISKIGAFFADEDIDDGQDLLKWIFNGEQNDGIVEIKSQKGGLPEKHCTVESTAYEGPVGIDSYAFHTMTTKWSETHENLETLLMARVSDERFDVNGFKANDTNNSSQSKIRIKEQTRFKTSDSEDTFISIKGNLRIENDSVKIDIELGHSSDIVKNIVFGFLDDEHAISGLGRDDYTFLFPNTYSGKCNLYALGRTENNEIVLDSVFFDIPAMATIQYIDFIGNPSGMSVGQKSVLSVKAIWSNGEETCIQPEFTTSDESILRVNSNHIEALSEGSCMLVATYEGHTISTIIDVVDYGEIDGLAEIRSEGEYKIYNDGETLYVEAPDARIRNIELRLFDASGTLIQNLHATTNGNKKAFSLDLGNRKGLFVVQCISDDFKGSYRFVY